MGSGRVDFERGMARLAGYARQYGHANPSGGEVWLDWKIGLWVSNLRKKYREGKLTSDQISSAQALGVNFERPYRKRKDRPPSRAERSEAEALRRLEMLKPYFRKNGNIDVGQVRGVDGWPTAGRWIARLRSKFHRGELPISVVAAAEKLNINWAPGQGRR